MNKLVISNILTTYLSRIWIGLVSLFSIPYLIRKLGVDAYGVFSLSLIFIGYSALFDFGLGRGIVKYIAEYHVLNNLEKLRKLIRSALLVYLIIGIASSVILGLFTYFLLGKIFHIPTFLAADASTVFYLTSLYLIIRIPQLLFQAISIGYQKIYLLNLLNTIFNTLKILASVAVVSFAPEPSKVVITNVIIGVVHFVFLYLFVEKQLPPKTIELSYDKESISEVLKYSIKSFTADSLGMIITYLDKIIIGIFLPISSLTYYSAPFELTGRLWEFQVSAVATTFPAFSGYHATGAKEEFNKLYLELTKFIVIISAFFSSLFCVFSREILTLWVNADFASKAYQALGIISWGILTSSILSIVAVVFYSIGNINRVIKVNSFCVFFHIIFCIIFITKFGINAVAVSWTATGVIGILLFVPWINKNIIGIKNMAYLKECIKPVVLSLLIISAFSFIFKNRLQNTFIFIAVIMVIFAIYAVLVWYMIISNKEKEYFKKVLLKQVILKRDA